MNCKATLYTKSKTKFFIEYHSSCLESMFKVSFLLNTTLGFCFKFWLIISTRVSLNVDRNGQDFRGREHMGNRWVGESLVWKPSWGKVKMQLFSVEAELLWRQSVIIYCLFCLSLSSPPSSLTQSTFWTSTSSSVWSQQIAMSLSVINLRAVCKTGALNWAVFTGCWCVFSKGEGCVALRAAQFCYTEFQVTLTHHGEKTGFLTGGIQLHTSEGKPTEKLYGESGNQLRTRLMFFMLSGLVASIPVLLCFQISSRLRGMTLSLQSAKVATSISKAFFFFPLCGYIKISQTWFPADIFCLPVDRFSLTQAHDISNPNYMVGMSFKSGNVIDKGWSYSMPPKNVPAAGQGSKDSKKPGYDVGTHSPTGKPCPL